MRLSMRSDYGVRALTDLAMHHGQGPIQSADVARRMSIPPVYLDQVFSALRKAGLVRSTRGPQGGHELARGPDAITMGDIVTVLEGPLPILDCLEDASACDLVDTCSQRPVWVRVRQAILTSLAEVSLADLALDMQEARRRPAYSI
jgi:Rrf2 family cysteine metabolism transcriptional repressor